MMLKNAVRGVVLAACAASFASAQAADPAAVENEDGKYYDAEGYPTFNIAEDGTVDFHTYSGFRRFNSECHVCHGPDGVGSTFAPALVESVQNMSYEDFVSVVAGGRENVGGGNQRVMPAFGTNANIMCYLDDIYIYLRARGEGDLPRGRPAKKEAKSDSYAEMEDACMG